MKYANLQKNSPKRIQLSKLTKSVFKSNIDKSVKLQCRVVRGHGVNYERRYKIQI